MFWFDRESIIPGNLGLLGIGIRSFLLQCMQIERKGAYV